MPYSDEVDNSYKLAVKTNTKGNRANKTMTKKDLDKAILILDSLTAILKNKDNISSMLSGFSGNPKQISDILSKVSSLKSVMDTDFDFLSLLNQKSK